MFCPDCGQQLSSETAKFCFKCGSPMPASGAFEAQQPAYAQQPGYAQQPTYAQQPAEQLMVGEQPKPRSKVGPIIGVVVGLIAAVGAFFGVRTLLGGDAPSLDEFAAGDGITFTEPTGRFSVAMPADPEERRQSAPLPDGSQLETVVYYVDEEPRYVFLAGYTDLGGRPFDLNAAAQGAAATVGGSITSQNPRSAGGVAGREIHMTVAGTTATMWMGASGGALYQLQAIGVPDGHPGVTHFFDSFKPAS